MMLQSSLAHSSGLDTRRLWRLDTRRLERTKYTIFVVSGTTQFTYIQYTGGRPTHTHGLSVHFREKYSICRVGRPCTLYICVSVKCVPLTSKIVYFVRPAPGKASREISTRENNGADLTCIIIYIVYFVAYRWSAYPAYAVLSAKIVRTAHGSDPR